MPKFNCVNCEHCSFVDCNGSPNRYYCDHRENPNAVRGSSSCTLICKTERHSKEFSIKRTPRWCPVTKGRTANEEHKK